VKVGVYTQHEVAAEKLRCVIQRLQARDLFNLNELFVINKVALDQIWPVFERNMREAIWRLNAHVFASEIAPLSPGALQSRPPAEMTFRSCPRSRKPRDCSSRPRISAL